MASQLRGAIAGSLLAVGAGSLVATNATPLSWAVASLCVWTTFVLCSSKQSLSRGLLHVFWAYSSTAAFISYLQIDPGFKAWSDVYYFCQDPRYCTCDFRWTWWGYLKFSILWNFVLSAALGVQKLVVHFCLDGLLPGEEVVTKESFVSICWRLIPYWLNNWEHEWGAECSSALFELPHFAVELLIVLPTVQIICSRLRILALPQLRVVVPAGEAEQDIPREDLAPNVMRGHWELDRRQRSLLARLRANKRVMLILAGVAILAATNAIVVPISMEAAVRNHPRSHFLQDMPIGAGPLTQRLQAAQARFVQSGCPSVDPINSVMRKHALELRKMSDEEHMKLVPLIEAALAIMRLSCEKFFVLASVFVAFLLFREPPLAVRHIIHLNARLSNLFQKVILYTFPAICWMYGAGFIFSCFVSVVFWGGPAVRLFEKLRLHSASVRPASLEPATEAEVERMDGHCPICWGDLVPGGPKRGMALPCRHAFHESCIVQWLHQCHGQGRAATCPMCTATVELRIQWRLPFGGAGDDAPQLPLEDEDDDAGEAAHNGGGLFPEIQAMIQEMDEIADPAVGEGAAMAWQQQRAALAAVAVPPQRRAPPAPPAFVPPIAAQQLPRPASPLTAALAAHSDGASSVVGQAVGPVGLPGAVPPPHHRPEPWQRQLSSGLSFGGGDASRSGAAAGGDHHGEEVSSGARFGVRTRSHGRLQNLTDGRQPSSKLTQAAGSQQEAEAGAAAAAAGSHRLPFTGRGFRLGSSRSAEQAAPAAAESAGGAEEQAEQCPPRRRSFSLRQRLPGRLGRSSRAASEPP